MLDSFSIPSQLIQRHQRKQENQNCSIFDQLF